MKASHLVSNSQYGQYGSTDDASRHVRNFAGQIRPWKLCRFQSRIWLLNLVIYVVETS